MRDRVRLLGAARDRSLARRPGRACSVGGGVSSARVRVRVRERVRGRVPDRSKAAARPLGRSPLSATAAASRPAQCGTHAADRDDRRGRGLLRRRACSPSVLGAAAYIRMLVLCGSWLVSLGVRCDGDGPRGWCVNGYHGCPMWANGAWRGRCAGGLARPRELCSVWSVVSRNMTTYE